MSTSVQSSQKSRSLALLLKCTWKPDQPTHIQRDGSSPERKNTQLSFTIQTRVLLISLSVRLTAVSAKSVRIKRQLHPLFLKAD